MKTFESRHGQMDLCKQNLFYIVDSAIYKGCKFVEMSLLNGLIDSANLGKFIYGTYEDEFVNPLYLHLLARVSPKEQITLMIETGVKEVQIGPNTPEEILEFLQALANDQKYETYARLENSPISYKSMLTEHMISALMTRIKQELQYRNIELDFPQAEKFLSENFNVFVISTFDNTFEKLYKYIKENV